jgi:DNA-binding HxlR family transcriptional regulator
MPLVSGERPPEEPDVPAGWSTNQGTHDELPSKPDRDAIFEILRASRRREVLRYLAAVLGRKWHPIIVQVLLERGPRGFADLEAALGVSRKVLSESLADLQEKDVVERTVVAEKPTRVEYSLTDRGAALEDAVDELDRWGREYLREHPTP